MSDYTIMFRSAFDHGPDSRPIKDKHLEADSTEQAEDLAYRRWPNLGAIERVWETKPTNWIETPRWERPWRAECPACAFYLHIDPANFDALVAEMDRHVEAHAAGFPPPAP